MRKRSLSALAVASLMTLSASALTALAAAEQFNIDPGHSSVGFKVRHIVSKVPGRFDKISGTIEVDPNDLSTAKVSVEIESASINTANENRDNDLKSPNFFDVAKFPKATFVSTAVTPNGEGKAKLKGNLTIRDVTKPVEFDVDVLGFGADPRGNTKAGFEARTTISRKDFGIDHGAPMIGDDVELTINIEAAKPKPKPAAG